MSEDQKIIYVEKPREKNGIGTAGFVLALIALFTSVVPGLGWLIWLLGLIFSFIGIFKQPKGLAIAGLCISLLGLILVIALAGVVAAMLF
ncbi:MAG: hypothetical protein LBP96_05470 [Bacteroidales bacterium]|jgi:hypothetical protein|nr:hypothetical protein [Bacteroidales bacterium]